MTPLQDRLASMVHAFDDEQRKYAFRLLAADVASAERQLSQVTAAIHQLTERARQLTIELRRADERADRAEERLKRLEAAGDEMAAWLRNPRNLGDDPFMADQWEATKGGL